MQQQNKRILVCAGTRPEIIKMAPVFHALAQAGLEPLALHTGQHEEMAWPLYEFFDMPPAVRLTPRRKGDSLAHLSGSVLEQAAEAIEALQPAAVLVQGDTSSALMCGLAAFYARLPVGHVEAGLRTYEADPFPEEKNRELLGRIARWHFTPTPRATENLAREAIAHGVHCVGNTVVDAVQLGKQRLNVARSQSVEGAALASFLHDQGQRKLILVTAHRRENWGAPMQAITQAVCQLIVTRPDLCFVWPLHQNPTVRETINTGLRQLSAADAQRLLLTEPMNYPDLLAALDHCYLTLTDSGGIQEEAATLRKPVLVMRESTERQELIEAGGGQLVGTDPARILAALTRLADDPIAYVSMRVESNPFGDGLASQRIAQTLLGSL